MSVNKTLTSHTLCTEVTDFYADSVEWCPMERYVRLLACGTYQLEENTAIRQCQSRLGNIVLYQLSLDKKSNDFALEKLCILNTTGILDMKWCPRLVADTLVLGTACSNGKIMLLKIHEGGAGVNLHSSCEINVTTNDSLALSLDWAVSENNSKTTLVASDSAGGLSYIEMAESDLCILKQWRAHHYEAWVSAFDYHQPDIIFSGSDDCCFKGWDMRTPVTNPVFVNKSHSMGVTSISKAKYNEHLLATGSYDENIFLWDTRKIKNPLSEVSASGGIWRLKWHPTCPEYLLSASMHSGFHVICIQENDHLDIAAKYEKHSSLAYGVDWFHASQELPKEEIMEGEIDIISKFKDCGFQSIVASCSFYDKGLHLWGLN